MAFDIREVSLEYATKIKGPWVPVSVHHGKLGLCLGKKKESRWIVRKLFPLYHKYHRLTGFYSVDEKNLHRIPMAVIQISDDDYVTLVDSTGEKLTVPLNRKDMSYRNCCRGAEISDAMHNMTNAAWMDFLCDHDGEEPIDSKGCLDDMWALAEKANKERLSWCF